MTWPESQEYMNNPDAIAITDDRNCKKYSNCAYLVPEHDTRIVDVIE